MKHLSISSRQLTDRALAALQICGWVSEPASIEAIIRVGAKEWTWSGRLPVVLLLITSIARPMLVPACSLMVTDWARRGDATRDGRPCSAGVRCKKI